MNKLKMSALALGVIFSQSAFATTDTNKPNILAIWGDDIGPFNISAYNRGVMGYQTPNIDRIANEGILFTDSYGDQSCTAGRAGFILGQHPIRTGLTKVGLPGAKEGINKADPTIAELLKPMGYMTGQFGKNHLGDQDEHLPTNHGFDEFFGNLYHLNAEDEPEHADYPKDPEFKKRFGPRGAIHSFADGKIEDTGPVTKKRMETIDEEFLGAALSFIDKAHTQKKPFFVWFNSTRMHIWTRLKAESEGVTGQGIYADGMTEHDGHVGQLLDKLEELGIAENTIVMYSTDNGAELLLWPDGGYTPFRGEKNSNWEGGYRIPMLVKWPNKIKPNQISNEIISLQDWMPTLLAAAGDDQITEKLKKGTTIGGTEYKVHLDGHNFLPHFMDTSIPGPRKDFIYASDTGDIVAIRDGDYKMVFKEQRAHALATWQDPYVELRAPKIFNLRMDPYERMDHESEGYGKWWAEHMFLMAPAMVKVGQFKATFEEFPQRQKPGSFVP
ncbi:arylsulfatase [Alginatibacterium sediminis]|uniref:Arylsulfatase n=1 Tax=Alginatibacterium sediminis TaxID=2164068 RepID=A0A420EIF9_9ALTE|nr:arylsulfatase [Alginatibacterium sediminis]RKF20356.1 arylsulfatase [Alginatibacterium sediminis]